MGGALRSGGLSQGQVDDKKKPGSFGYDNPGIHIKEYDIFSSLFADRPGTTLLEARERARQTLRVIDASADPVVACLSVGRRSCPRSCTRSLATHVVELQGFGVVGSLVSLVAQVAESLGFRRALGPVVTARTPDDSLHDGQVINKVHPLAGVLEALVDGHGVGGSEEEERIAGGDCGVLLRARHCKELEFDSTNCCIRVMTERY